ncbi:MULTISPECIES: YwqG family protein [Methylomonas]|uniref:YwqG family protein n=1 Tax=Methylomonas TaxID=416 RepID=UPI001231E73E
MNEKISALGNKCLRLVTADGEMSSFLGGKPLVATHVLWPRKHDKPLGFIGQIDLAEINRNSAIDWLPEIGRLLFFYDLHEWPWGFDPDDKGGWAVIYENGLGELKFQEAPSDLAPEYLSEKIKYLKSEPFISYPDSRRIDPNRLDWEEDTEYDEFIDSNYGAGPRHQIGGFPYAIQNDTMEEECQLASGGVYCGNSEGYDCKQAEALKAHPNDWRLLLQFDSDEDIDAMWGDMGMLYFWVRESDARAAGFDDAWMILQCY